MSYVLTGLKPGVPEEDTCQVWGVGARVPAFIRVLLGSLPHRGEVREKKEARILIPLPSSFLGVGMAVRSEKKLRANGALGSSLKL